MTRPLHVALIGEGFDDRLAEDLAAWITKRTDRECHVHLPTNRLPLPAAVEPEDADVIEEAAGRLGIGLPEARRYGKALVRWAKAGFPSRDDAEVERILTRCCQPCPYYHNGWCRECGCRINRGRAIINKVRMATEDCPRGRWDHSPPKELPATFVYPYLAAAAVGNELLYSVRSVEANYRGEADIWIVGDRPAWWRRDDRFIHCPQVKGGARIDRANKLHVLSLDERIPESFFWMQDDIYLTAPVDHAFLATPWTRQRSPMTAKRLDGWRPSTGFQRQKLASYRALLARDKPLEDFAAHCPVLYSKANLRKMIHDYNMLRTQHVDDLVYGNEFADPSRPATFVGELMCRVIAPTSGDELRQRLAVAKMCNHLHGQYRGVVEDYLADTFSAPSRWENPSVNTVSPQQIERSIVPFGPDFTPKIGVCCITYGRPDLVSTLVGCFARQDYPADKCEMIILDDGGQLRPGSYTFNGKPVRVIVSETRYPTIGEKRNAARKLLSPDVDAVTQWDDDDIYLPWALEAMADRLRHVGIAICTWGHWQEADGRITTVRKMFHGTCCFRAETFDLVGGYPPKDKAEDIALLAHFVGGGGKGKCAHERNTMDVYHPYIVVRRRIGDTYHATSKQFNYANAVKRPGNDVVVTAAELPEDIAAWFAGTVQATAIDGRKPVRDSIRSANVPTSGVAEWHLTYACDLNCPGCNRACFLPPRTKPMTIADAEEFVRQCRELHWSPRIFVLGGEPCLHPDFLAFLEIARSLTGYPEQVVVWSNGYSEKTKALLAEVERCSLAAIQKNTWKTAGSKLHKYQDMFLDPTDFGVESRSKCNCHAGCGRCGVSVDHDGYTLCPSGGMIDTYLNLGIRTRRLADLFDETFAAEHTAAMCRHCGFRLGVTPERTAASKLIHETLMSPTWQRAAESGKA